MYTPRIRDTDHTDRRINQLGASLFFDPITIAHASANGIDDVFALYAGGRAGVLGDVTATQAAAALGFFPVELVRVIWAHGQAIMQPAQIARIYADAMSEAARQVWDCAAAKIVVELGTVVADSVPLLGLPLFAGRREMARPSDPVGAAVHVVHTLRELRGDIHVQSVGAQGLRPLEAEVVSRGSEGAALHQWPQPWPDPAPFVEQVAAADAATGERMCRMYACAIGVDGFTRFADAVDRIKPA